MKLKDIFKLETKTIAPQSDVHYHLYSLPSFDDNQTREEVKGQDIMSNKLVVPNRCILFNKLNVRFKRVWRINNQDENKLASTEFLPLIVNEQLVDFNFAYFLLVSDSLTNYLCGQNSNTSGSHKRIDPNVLLNMDITLPTRSEQERTGKLLTEIDEKIALNREINRNLEAMARQLYDYWFVQFDFPDKNGKPYKSSGGKMVWNEKLKREIPADWDVKELGELVVTNRGISYSTKTISGEGVPMINLASFNVDGSYKPSGLKVYSGEYSEEKILCPFDLVMCNTQQTAIDYSKDIIGKAFLVPYIFDTNVVSSHHVTTIRPIINELKPYLSCLMNTLYFHRYAAGCCSGTNIMGLNMSGLMKYRMEIPPKNILTKFYDLILNVEQRKGLLIRDTDFLIRQRDELLPLLMNGQVSVIQPEVNCDLEAAKNCIVSFRLVVIKTLSIHVVFNKIY